MASGFCQQGRRGVRSFCPDKGARGWLVGWEGEHAHEMLLVWGLLNNKQKKKSPPGRRAFFEGIKPFLHRHGDGLLAIRAYANGGDRAAYDFAEALNVGLAVFRQLVPGGAFGNVLLPAGEGFVDRGALGPVFHEGGRVFQHLVAHAVTGADFDALQLIEAVEVGHGHFIKTIEHGGEAQNHAIRPAAAAGAPGGSSELAAQAVQVVAEFVILCHEGTFAHASGVCLADADDFVDTSGGYAGAGAAAACAGVGAGNEGIGAEVDVEHGTLCALEQDGFAGLDGVVEHGDGVGDVRAEYICCCHDGTERHLRVGSGPAKTHQFLVGGLNAGFEHSLQAHGVGKVNHADANSTGFVGIGGADTLASGADFLVAEGFLLGAVDVLVYGQYNVGAIGDEEVSRGDGDTFLSQVLDFLHEGSGVNNDAVADDVYLTLPQDAGGDEVQNIFLPFGDNGVAGVAATLAASHNVCGFCQEVDDLAFAFISPLGAYNECVHE